MIKLICPKCKKVIDRIAPRTLKLYCKNCKKNVNFLVHEVDIVHNVDRKNLIKIIHKATNALANSCKGDTFELSIDFDESSVEIIKEAK